MADGGIRVEAEKIIEIYQRHALAFDRLRSRALFEKGWLDRFLDTLPEERAVLDLGCGTAEPIARYLIENGCRVTGVDTSCGMLSLCRERFPDHRWVRADMRQLARHRISGRGFDGLVAWDSFFLLTPADQRGMFEVFRMHLTGGGVLLFTSGPEASERIGSFEGEAVYCSSLDEHEYRTLLDAHGFDVISHVVEDPGCDRHTVWLARSR